MARDEQRSKQALLKDLGYGGDPALVEVLLLEAGLSNPRKENIQAAKAEAVRALLEANFLLVCARGDCRQEAKEASDRRTVVPASDPGHCGFCGGSANRRAVAEMVKACRKRGWRRICVVGGSPNARTNLQQLVGKDLDLRLVDGTIARSRGQADSDLGGSDVVVIWGSTQLNHKVSSLYKGPNVVQMARRSIQELARSVVTKAGRTP